MVEDDPENLELLSEYLEGMGYAVTRARDGDEAWKVLQLDGQAVDVVLLDRIMPNLDGMQVLALLQADPRLRTIPVIMQTAAGAPDEVREGIEAGVFYYLTKPFDASMLEAIVTAATRKGMRQREALEDLAKQSKALRYLRRGMFDIRTLEETYDLAVTLASACPEPGKVVMGLNDMLVNAVEHGNLGITFDEKTVLQEEDRWEQEIAARLALPENAGKFVTVTFERRGTEIHILIQDQGNGFDWRSYEAFDPRRGMESHGRGIAMAKALYFDRVEFQGNGNTVLCVIDCRLDPSDVTNTPFIEAAAPS